MSGYLCCAACLHAIHGETDEGILVDGFWYHPEHVPEAHAPGPAEITAIEA